jgi:hypothetical protein
MIRPVRDAEGAGCVTAGSYADSRRRAGRRHGGPWRAHRDLAERHPEGAEVPPRALPFKKADSFILIAEDDTLTVAQLGDDEILGADLPPGETISTTLAFSVGASSRLIGWWAMMSNFGASPPGQLTFLFFVFRQSSSW